VDENIDRFFKAFRTGLAMGWNNLEIARAAGLRYPSETRYRADLIRELRKIFEEKRKLNKRRQRAKAFQD